MAEMTYIQAISDALRQEMRRDPRVFLLGEDVGVYGGAFKVSLGVQEEFGPWRVIDTPRREAVLPGADPGSDRRPPPVRRRLLGRTVPLPEPGELVRTPPRAQGRLPRA